MRPKSCREFIEDLTGHSTRRLPAVGSGAGTADLWYLVYRDEEGTQHTVKGSTAAIRRSLKDGLLGDASNIRASRNKTGPFELLSDYPEFRDMLIVAAPLQVPSSSSRLVAAPTKPTYHEPTAHPPSGSLPRADAEVMPHIELGRDDRDLNVSWLTWAVLFAIAVGSALAAFYLLPPGWFR
jgi:hypothetical protein